MWLGALLLLLAGFAFASAGLYYVAAILVLFGKLLGALIGGVIGGVRLCYIGAFWLARALWRVGRWWFVLMRDVVLLGADEAQAATGSAHRAGMVTIEWLKRTYVQREKRGRGL